jgi:hypothetical protein
MDTTQKKALEQAIEETVGLGRMWARTGLELARRSLEASSASIGTAAKLLGELSRALDDAPPEAPAAEPTPAP